MRACGVMATTALLLSMVLSTSAPFADAQPTEYQSPPYLQRLFPDKGHIVGGTTVTIYGGGFRRGGGLTVRFSAESGEVDEVPATYVDAGRITCVTPARLAPHDAHVAVSNNGVAFSSFPLVDLDEGTYLHFAFVDEVPRGTWSLDVAAGSFRGGTTVTVFDENHRMSTRRDDKNFLPGAHLFCRFGNARNASATQTFNVSVVDKTVAHPRFGVGYHRGYVVDPIDAPDPSVSSSSSPHAVRHEGIALTLVRGRSYAFRLDASVAGFPFYFTTAEPREWREGAFVGEVIDNVTNSRGEGVSVVTYTVAASAPDTLYYACGAFRAMGGVARVVDEAETSDGVVGVRAGPLAANRNAVPAVWLSYNKIQCVTPPWDGVTDDDRAHGGHQVTVFVTNDGLTYSAGFGDGDGANVDDGGDADPSNDVGAYPARVGQGATFTYFDSNPFLDPPKFTPASTPGDVALALAGGPKAAARFFSSSDVAALSAASLSGAYFYHYELEETHSFSDAYDDFGRRKAYKVNASLAALSAAANTSDAVAALADGDAANDPAASRNDLSVSGEYVGGGVAWFEVVVDGAGANFTSVRWRKHFGGVNTSTPWARTNVSVPADDRQNTPETVEGVALGDGVVAGFVRVGAHHAVGDRWTFRAFSGFPGVGSVSTSHDEPRIAARGPMEGRTEITVRGSGFFPGRGQLLCRLGDPDPSDPNTGNAETSGIVSTTEATSTGADADSSYGVDTDSFGVGADSIYRKMRCVTERHPPALGGREVLATLSPCVNKTLTVSHDGGGSFSKADVAFFLFCDVHVSVSGSDVVGTGTPGNPYKTLQRGVEAALAAPRFPDAVKQRTFAETAAAAAYGPGGFGATEFGVSGGRGASRRAGFGYVLNRDRLRLGAGTYAGNGNRGVHPLGKMVEVEAKAVGSVTVDCEDSGVSAVVSAGDRHAEHASGAISMSGVHEVNCNERSV